MDKLPILLNQLKENGVTGAYSDIMTDISKLIQDVAKAEGEVQSKINTLVADKKYDKIACFTPIPQQINECVQEIYTIFKTVPAVDKQKVPEPVKAKEKTEIKREEIKEKPVPTEKVASTEAPKVQKAEEINKKENIPAPQPEPVKNINKPASAKKEDDFIVLMED